MNSDIRSAKTARILSYLIAAILVLLPFHEFLVVWLGSNIGHLDALRIWKEILIVLMVPPAVWLLLNSPKAKRALLKSWIFRLYILYIFLHIVLGVWAFSADRLNSSAFIYALIINLRFIGFLILCAGVAAGNDFLKNNWLKIVLIPAAATILFGIIQILLLPLDFLKHFGYGPKTIPAYQTVDNNLNYQRVQSTLRGANPFGAYLVVVITAAINRLKDRTLLKPIYILAALAAIFFTYSRSAWIGLFLALCFLVYTKARRINAHLVYGALIIVVAFAAGLYIARNQQSVQDALLHTSNGSTSVKTSNEARSSALQRGAQDIIDQPLGRGPGTAGPASNRNTKGESRIAENYYLQLGQEVGIFGLAIFLAINALVVHALWTLRKDGLAKVLLASFIGICFINLVSHAWTDDTLSMLWWGLAGIVIGPAILNNKNKHNENLKNQP